MTYTSAVTVLTWVSYFENTDMAVVVSKSPNEIEEFQRRDWTSPHIASGW
jgi:hypothetical protein